MGTKGTLFLIPSTIAEHSAEVIPAYLRTTVSGIQHYVAENVRAARRFISLLKVHPAIDELNIQVLDKDTKPEALAALLAPLFQGRHVGVLSEAGCPGVADPGALAVAFAHQHGISVAPLVGPSSILLALMASGLNGQKFAFHGYLPIHEAEARRTIRDYETESRKKKQTQLFIETPHRNNLLFQRLVSTLHDSTRLSISVDLTGASQESRTKLVAEWKRCETSWPKLPAIFLFQAG
jgi:16S rRNA (cytidine1402-2'-O)-methyltransferase